MNLKEKFVGLLLFISTALMTAILLPGSLVLAPVYAATNSVANVISNVQVGEACTISLPSNAIDFGTQYPGVDLAPTNAITDQNQGNIGAYLYVDAGNWIGAGTNTFYATNTVYGITSGSISNVVPFYLAAGSPTNTLVLLPAGTPGVAGSNTIYFGVNVPIGQPADTYTQNIIITNVC